MSSNENEIENENDPEDLVPHTSPTSDLTEESNELIQQLQAIFNQIFTKEYLDTDPFLQSQVGLPLSLPTSAIYQSPRVLYITTDPELIRQALETANSLIVTENIIRPNVKAEQQTIILRDVEETVTEETIKELFEKAECPSLVGCRSEMNNTWFVTFASETDARLSLDKIKSISLAGKPVRARLKTESLVRAYPRSQSGSNNSSPTYRPPQLVIEDNSNTLSSSNQSQQATIPQSPQYFYPPMFPIPPQLMTPNGQSPNGSGTPQYPPNMPYYYMYPPFPNGYPMHPGGPMGSPMYMGWPMPPYPMMQISPNGNPTGAPGQHTGRGKHKQKGSPRGGSNQSYSPSRYSQNKGFNQKDRNGSSTPQADVPTSPNPSFQSNEKAEIELSEEQKDQLESNGNRKKFVKKRRDRFPTQENGQVEETKTNGLLESVVSEDRKKKEPHSQYQPNKNQPQNTGDSNNARAKVKDKSKQGKVVQNKPNPPKPENKFNLDADFPILHNAPVVSSHPAAPMSSLSWAARISKSSPQSEPVPHSQAKSNLEPTPVIAHQEQSDQSGHNVESPLTDELNISFGSLQTPSSQSNDLILPPTNHNSFHYHTPFTEKQSVTSNLPKKFEDNNPPIILTNIHENLEYVPISFGAFEATIPVSSDSFSPDSSDASHTVDGKKTFLDIARRGKA